MSSGREEDDSGVRLSIEGSHFLSRGVWKVQGRGRTQSTYSVDCPRLEERLFPGGAPAWSYGAFVCVTSSQKGR